MVTEAATVLVVDDSPLDRKLAGKIVEKSPRLRAVYAENGHQALRMLADDETSIVLTDLLMPEMDGLELVAAVRQLHPFVPVVLMTAHGSEETAVRALAAGAASYVPKRSLASELADTIDSVLSVARGARDEQLVFQMLTMGEMCFEVRHEPREVTALVKHYEALVRQLELCDQAASLQVGIAVREALINAVEHGNLALDSSLKETGGYDEARDERRQALPYCERRVRVMTHIQRDEVRWTITDEGDGFDPSDVPDPTDPLNLDRVYGRGLLLIRTFMDEVRHNAKGNQITMIKRRKAC